MKRYQSKSAGHVLVFECVCVNPFIDFLSASMLPMDCLHLRLDLPSFDHPVKCDWYHLHFVNPSASHMGEADAVISEPFNADAYEYCLVFCPKKKIVEDTCA